MPDPDESPLVAVVLPSSEAASAVLTVWDRGDAVTVIDPGAPGLAARLDALAPTGVLDRAGEHRRPEGRPVPRGVGAVVATSGTTGTARAVMLDHTALRASARAVNDALRVDPDRDRWLACLPLSGVAGLAIVARAHAAGTPLTVHDRFDVDAVAAAAGDATLVSLVPTTLRRLLDAHPDAPRRFRRILLGGGSIPERLPADAERAGATLATTYGLTETGGGCVHDGHPLAGVEVRLEAATDEILVRGPVVMRGYRDAAEPSPWRDGWLATGDVGCWGDTGTLEVVDRIKDLVITGGVNVSPVAVERRLVDVPGIADLAIVGVPDPEWGERVVAYVVADGDPPSVEELRRHGDMAGLTPAELPREIRVLDEIPRSTGGKVLRRRLRD